MNVITVASRKGGAGKTTLTAHLAVQAHREGRRVHVIDANSQGSLALCNSLRAQALPFATAERGIERAVAMAMVAGAEWVFIDTAPTMWVVVQEAIRAATMVIVPARPGFLDLAAVADPVKTRARAGPRLCGGAQRRAAETRRQGSARDDAFARLSRCTAFRSGPARSASAPPSRSRSAPA